MKEVDNSNLSKEWVKAAFYDLENIRYILKAEHLTHIVALHSQQAIEKLFKALIIQDSNTIPKVHDLIKLYKLVKKKIVIEDDTLLEDLNDLYLDSRYPSDMGLLPYGKPSLEDAKEFYEFAQGIFDEVCEVLEIKKELFYE